MTVTSRAGTKPARFIPATAASPASTPAAPSKLPPCCTLSRWLPSMHALRRAVRCPAGSVQVADRVDPASPAPAPRPPSRTQRMRHALARAIGFAGDADAVEARARAARRTAVSASATSGVRLGSIRRVSSAHIPRTRPPSTRIIAAGDVAGLLAGQEGAHRAEFRRRPMRPAGISSAILRHLDVLRRCRALLGAGARRSAMMRSVRMLPGARTFIVTPSFATSPE